MATVADPVHGHGWNTAERWGGWSWREPRRGDHFRTCSFCGSIHPEDLAAEQEGSGTCQACGLAGWEACFRGQVPVWAWHLTGEQKGILTAEESASLEGKHARHDYSPGGWWASWADRKYGWPHKFYVEGLKPRDPEMLHCIGASPNDPDEGSFGRMGMQWHKVSECPPELLEAARQGGMVHSAENPDGWLGFGTRPALSAKFYSVHLADPRVSDEVKHKIYRACGLQFTFSGDGRVGWQQYLPPAEPAGGQPG